MSWLLKAVGQVAKRIEPIAVKAATQAKPAIQTAVRTAARLPAPAKVLGALGATAAGLSMAIAAQHPKAPPYRAVVIDHRPPPPPPPGAKCENRGDAIVCTTVTESEFWKSLHDPEAQRRRRIEELQKRQDEILQLMRQRIQDWQKVQAMQMQYGRVDPRALAPPPSFSDLEKELADIQKELESLSKPQPQPSPPSKPAQWHALASPPSKQLVPTWAAIGAGAAGLAAVVGALLARRPGVLKIMSKPVTEAAVRDVAKPRIFTPFLSIFRRAPEVAKTEAKVSEIAKAARIGEAEKAAMQASSRAAREVAAKAAARNIVEQATRSAHLAKFAKYAKYGAGIGALGLIGYGVYRMFTGAEGALGTEGGAGAAGVGQMPQSQIITGPSGEKAVVDVGMIPRMVEPGPAPGVGGAGAGAVGGLGGFGGAGAVGGGEAGGEAGGGTNAGPLGGYVPPAGGYGYVGGGEAGAGAPQMPGVGGSPGAVGGGFVQSHLLWILGGVALIVIIALLLSRK